MNSSQPHTGSPITHGVAHVLGYAGHAAQRAAAALVKTFARRDADLANDKFTDAFERELLDREFRRRYR